MLDFPDWKITAIEREYARTLLPLAPSASNQYTIHQAALMLLAADYTGGLVLASLLHLVPIIGFFPSVDDNAGYLWGAKASIRWHAPNCHSLTCKAKVAKPRWEDLAKRFTNSFVSFLSDSCHVKKNLSSRRGERSSPSNTERPRYRQ